MAGTVTVTLIHESFNRDQMVFKLACVGDGTDGSVPATAIPDTRTSPYWEKGFFLYEVWTVTPASGNPDASDVTISDALGLPLFTQANVISASVSTKTKGTMSDNPTQVNSQLTMTVANQATVSATWDIYVKLAK